MENKETTEKIDFLKISKEEQESILKEALIKGQEEQEKLEEKYERLQTRGIVC
ncbi:hypothetical protein BMS3Abin15_01131 [bacterium BMS3Abin15]|nr:hypothetical protein BMS3Abin15_01131 [bacterium BMS3Abin15]